ncbi:MAG: heme exporter protein CcmB [Bacillota bacterium]
MGKRFSPWALPVWAIIRKDLLEEFRTRYAVNSLVMFAVTTLVMVSFAVGPFSLDQSLHAAFIWIILFFSAMTGLARSFVKEEENKTAAGLKLSASPEIVYLGKLLFNLLVMLGLTLILIPIYLLLMVPPIGSWWLMLFILFLGNICLAGAVTILAAIVARAGSKNALLPTLSFPILLPVLITAISVTETALGGGTFSQGKWELQFLVSYGVILIAASILLFNYVWYD